MYGENGVLLEQLTEAQLEAHLRPRNIEHCVTPCILFMLITFGYVSTHLLRWPHTDAHLATLCIVVALAAIVCSSTTAFAIKAIDRGDLPANWSTPPTYQHLSGSLILGIIVFASALMLMARALGRAYSNVNLSDGVGLIILALTVALISALVLFPVIIGAPIWGKLYAKIGSKPFERSALGGMLRLTSQVASKIDSWLVYSIAPSVGASLEGRLRRYFVFLGYLISCALFAWFAPPTFSFVALIWSFVICIAIARRWSWIESDRETTLRNPSYSEDDLKIGIDEDLRDEALCAIACMVFLLPIGIRAAHLSSGATAFSVPVGAENNILTWMSFFGVELAKAAPFVDWFDIYGAKSIASIQNTSAMGSHIIFGARALIDLLFLSTLVKAFSLSVRTLTHKRMFFEREINLLDQPIESLEFHKLHQNLSELDANDEVGREKLLGRFSHYDVTRLTRLKALHDSGSVMHDVSVWIRQLSDVLDSSLDEKFLEAVFEKKPDVNQVEQTLGQLISSNDMSITALVAARDHLNKIQQSAQFNLIRGRIIDAILDSPVGKERSASLRAILSGTNFDNVLDNRLKVVEPLKRTAWFDRMSLRALRRSESKDRSKAVRLAVERALNALEAGRIPELSSSSVQRELESTSSA